ncbi:hypothetical protein B0H11DRAFT_1905830 [Mycena galericulata]|nr:hypothetical protein B0H11DRAFT_1905830 [Mycena galericulata]
MANTGAVSFVDVTSRSSLVQCAWFGLQDSQRFCAVMANPPPLNCAPRLNTTERQPRLQTATSTSADVARKFTHREAQAARSPSDRQDDSVRSGRAAAAAAQAGEEQSRRTVRARRQQDGTSAEEGATEREATATEEGMAGRSKEAAARGAGKRAAGRAVDLCIIAEPLGLATLEKMRFVPFSATSTNNILSATIGHPKKINRKWRKM